MKSLNVFLCIAGLTSVLAVDRTVEQLRDWALHNYPSLKGQTVTNAGGVPIPSLEASQTVGVLGPILVTDTTLLETLSRFNRERIPERSVHAKGSGAFGYFEVTDDITNFSIAKLFAKLGLRTSVVVRFSTVTGESGSADLVQDSRGFAVKFKTEDGNWDLVGINFQNFPIRDPILFPFLIRTRKRNPRTRLGDPNMRWDFDSLRPETTFNNLFRQSGLGIPDGYRHMDGFGVHAFKLINNWGKHVYCKFHLKTDQGIKNLTLAEANAINGENLDYAQQDLYNAIANKNFPSWTMYIQVMTQEEADILPYNPFDITKVWLETDFPLIRVGRLVLNENPLDYFTQVEEVGFDPGNLVPGIDVSPDRMLHGRMFSYQDAQRYRLGANHGLIEVNRPRSDVTVKNYFRDGACVGNPADNGLGGPNYFPNSFDGLRIDPRPELEASYFENKAEVGRYDLRDEDNFSQATYYWNNIFGAQDKDEIAASIVSTLKDAYDFIQKRAINNFSKVSKDLGRRISQGIEQAKTSNYISSNCCSNLTF